MTDLNRDEVKKNQNGQLKKTEIFNSANSQYFSRKFQGFVLGLLGEIEAKNSNVAQPICLSGCPM